MGILSSGRGRDYLGSVRFFADAAKRASELLKSAALGSPPDGVRRDLLGLLERAQREERGLFSSLASEFLPPIEREDIAAAVFSFSAAAAGCLPALEQLRSRGSGPAGSLVIDTAAAGAELAAAAGLLGRRGGIPDCCGRALQARSKLFRALALNGGGDRASAALWSCAGGYLRAAETLCILCLKNS